LRDTPCTLPLVPELPICQNGISVNARAFWSIVNTRKMVGYASNGDAELQYADDIRKHLVGPTLQA
jgi:hypothetical protein